MTGRAALIAALVVIAAAGVPLVLSNYQVGLATEVLIFGILAMSIDILAGFAGRTSLGHGAIFGVSTYVVVYCHRPGRPLAGVGFRARACWRQRWSRRCSRCSRCAPPASTSCC